jgi:hypothetical protein
VIGHLRETFQRLSDVVLDLGIQFATAGRDRGLFVEALRLSEHPFYEDDPPVQPIFHKVRQLIVVEEESDASPSHFLSHGPREEKYLVGMTERWSMREDRLIGSSRFAAAFPHLQHIVTNYNEFTQSYRRDYVSQYKTYVQELNTHLASVLSPTFQRYAHLEPDVHMDLHAFHYVHRGQSRTSPTGGLRILIQDPSIVSGWEQDHQVSFQDHAMDVY